MIIKTKFTFTKGRLEWNREQRIAHKMREKIIPNL